MTGKQIVGKRFTIGLNGFEKRSLTSVETMRQQYIKALSENFEICFINAQNDSNNEFDAVVTYYDPRYWLQPRHPNYPLIFAIHGDAVSRQEFLREHLGYLQTTDTLIFNCSSDDKILRKMIDGPQPNMCQLHFPVDITIFKRLDKRECRTKLKIDKADFVVGFVGRLIPQKNLHQFLRMFAALKKLFASKKLVGLIAGKFTKAYPVLDYGSGEYENYINNLQLTLDLEIDLLLLGELSPEDLSFAYGAMDVLFHPTNNLEEAFGNVPVEAMACGIPVVGAAYGGLKDTIVPEETGYLMPTWITKSGVRTDFLYGLNAVTNLLNDSSLRRKMSELGIKRVNDRYTYDSFASQLCKLVHRTIKRHRDEENIKQLVVNKSSSLIAPNSFLPMLDKPWEFYMEAVSSYVSTTLPKLNSQSRLISSKPILHVNGSEYGLDDPAFPAKFNLTEEQLKILKYCEQKRKLSDLFRCGFNKNAVDELLKLGLILCTHFETIH